MKSANLARRPAARRRRSRRGDLHLHALRARQGSELRPGADRQFDAAFRHQRRRQARARLDREAAHADDLPRDHRRRCTSAIRRHERRGSCARCRSTSATASRAGRSTTCSGRRTAASRPMLEAAMERRYSASPGETFFTGAGAHTFSNFKREDDGKNADGARGAARVGQPRVHPHHARRRLPLHLPRARTTPAACCRTRAIPSAAPISRASPTTKARCSSATSTASTRD